MKKIGCIFNSAPHYRLPIYKLMIDEFSCDFFFSKNPVDTNNIPQISTQQLENLKKIKTKKITKYSFLQKGVLKLLFSYDVLIIGGMLNNWSDWLILIFSKLTKTQVFIWTHGWYGKETLIKKTVKKIFYNLAEGLFLYGNYAKDLMINEGFSSNKLHVIYNSLDYDKQLIIRKNTNQSNIFFNHFKNIYPTIIFIGRLTKIKKLEMIPMALSILQKKNIICNSVFIGSGEEEKNLKSLFKKFSLNNYWFYGETYDEQEIANLIYNADVCISPGNVGLTAIHSLTFGTPVITHDNFPFQMPEFEAIIPGVTGNFFKSDNIHSLAATIEKWINRNDRVFIRKSCYQTIGNFWNPHFQLKVLHNVLNQK